jgi:class 3 adenylate cyclase/tetratricopeptide (TPR) repeat protein
MPVCGSCGTENPEIARFCLACGQPLEQRPPPQEVRKVVTILFSDLKGSTNLGEALDSEALREVMSRYFEAMQAEIERHGGTIEKFIGDAVMAVFGLPRLHEDDALRAVRAAAGMQRALGELNEELERRWGVQLANRTGVNTGEVVAGDPTDGQRLVTGDAVNVAARLEQAAGEREVLLGGLTYRLVRQSVDAEPVEPLELKGKSEPVPAYRLVSVHDAGDALRSRGESPLVGRDDQLETLTGTFRAAVDARACRVVLLAGEAGVGKSRLTEELARSVEHEALVLSGRCLPYGDGVTFWPIVETVRSAAGIRGVGSVESAREQLEQLAGADAADVVERVASAIGLAQRPFPVEELFWGIRRLFELLSRRSPLLIVFEDLHWAEATFLDLVDHLVADAQDAPILLVCTTRPDLLERRDDWPQHPDAARIVLARLTARESEQIVENLLGQAELDPAVSRLVTDAAEGNPLFVEQMMSMLVDEGLLRFEDGRWISVAGSGSVNVPPSIQALLAARLDSLEQDERAVLEPASVVGYVFPDEAVRDLVHETLAPSVDAELSELTRKQFVRPEQSLVQNGHRFQHILVRDTTYDGMLKRARATLHERFVRWADRVNPERNLEYEEILGYHLEQAYRYLSELGPLGDDGHAIGADGARRLASAGHRAFARGDAPAAASLLGRAVALHPEDAGERLELLPDYGDALLQVGRFQEAEAVLRGAIERAETTGADRVRANASLVQLLVKLRAGDPENWRKEVSLETVEAIAVFEREGDHAGLAKAWRLLAWSHGMACSFGNAAGASEQALQHARLAGDARQQSRAATAYAAAALFGPTPVAEGIGRCEQMVEQVSGDRHSEGVLLALLASLLAMQGSFERARELSARGRAMLAELGLGVEAASAAVEAWRVEMLAGDSIAAERELRQGYDTLVEAGERYHLSTVAGLLAQTLYVLGRFDEVEPLGRLTGELAADDDVDSQALWRCVLGKVRARQGSPEEGEELIRSAIEILEPTDAVLFQYGALLDLAEVQRLQGGDGVEASLEEARRLAELKGSPVMAGTIDELSSPRLSR